MMDNGIARGTAMPAPGGLDGVTARPVVAARRARNGPPSVAARTAPRASQPGRGGAADVDVPWRVCRVLESLLGEVEVFAADHEVAGQLERALPGVRQMVRHQRAFTGRAVRDLADAGVDQFLDLGCGLLAAGGVHETLLACAPAARSVHVDLDVVAVERAQTVVAGSNRRGVAAAIRADLRSPSSVFAHPQVTRLLDFDRPVAVIATGVLAFLADDEVVGLLDAVWDATVAGSWLAVTHPTADVHPQVAALEGIIGARPRSQMLLRSMLAGWQMYEAGLSWVTEWLADPHDTTAGDDTGRGAQRYLLAAVARRPTGAGR